MAIFADGWIKDVWPAGPLWLGAALMAVAAVVSFQLPRAPRIGGRPGAADLLQVARDPVLGAMAYFMFTQRGVHAYSHGELLAFSAIEWALAVLAVILGRKSLMSNSFNRRLSAWFVLLFPKVLAHLPR